LLLWWVECRRKGARTLVVFRPSRQWICAAAFLSRDAGRDGRTVALPHPHHRRIYPRTVRQGDRHDHPERCGQSILLEIIFSQPLPRRDVPRGTARNGVPGARAGLWLSDQVAMGAARRAPTPGTMGV